MNPLRAAPVVAEDRDVRAAESGTTQRTMTFGNGSMTNAQTHGFITYLERDVNAPADSPLSPRNLGQTTGTVDIAGYMGWLREHGYYLTGDACAPARR